MAYTPVPTKSTGDLWTAADNNTYLRDNFAAGVPDIFTAKGDIAAATGADVAVAVPVASTAGYVLTADSGESAGVKWGALLSSAVGARFKKSSSQSIAHETVTVVNFQSEDYDTDGAVSTGVGWAFTCPTGEGGYYLVAGTLMIQATSVWTADDLLQLDVYIDGVLETNLGTTYAQTGSNTYRLGVGGAAILSVSQGEAISLRAYQSNGSSNTLTITGTGTMAHCSIFKLG